MPHQQHNEASKSDVQTTKLNKLPVPGEVDTEFSAEQAAEAFEQNPSANRADENQQ